MVPITLSAHPGRSVGTFEPRGHLSKARVPAPYAWRERFVKNA